MVFKINGQCVENKKKKLLTILISVNVHLIVMNVKM